VKVGGKHFRTIWRKPDDQRVVQLIDQRSLPHDFVIEEVRSVEQMATAIREMHVRGAGLIGASAGYGMYLAALEAAGRDSFDEHMTGAAAELKATRAAVAEYRRGKKCGGKARPGTAHSRFDCR
jgi:methylthioribose-1-phosphate isomerase